MDRDTVSAPESDTNETIIVVDDESLPRGMSSTSGGSSTEEKLPDLVGKDGNPVKSDKLPNIPAPKKRPRPGFEEKLKRRASSGQDLVEGDLLPGSPIPAAQSPPANQTVLEDRDDDHYTPVAGTRKRKRVYFPATPPAHLTKATTAVCGGSKAVESECQQLQQILDDVNAMKKRFDQIGFIILHHHLFLTQSLFLTRSPSPSPKRAEVAPAHLLNLGQASPKFIPAAQTRVLAQPGSQSSRRM